MSIPEPIHTQIDVTRRVMHSSTGREQPADTLHGIPIIAAKKGKALTPTTKAQHKPVFHVRKMKTSFQHQ